MINLLTGGYNLGLRFGFKSCRLFGNSGKGKEQLDGALFIGSEIGNRNSKESYLSSPCLRAVQEGGDLEKNVCTAVDRSSQGS